MRALLLSLILAAGVAAAPGASIEELWNFSDAAASEAAFFQRLASIGPEDPPGFRLELLTQIARAQGLQGDFDAARSTLEQVSRSRPEPGTPAQVRMLLERGRVENSSGNRKGSVLWFWAAFQAALGSKLDYYVVDAAHMLAIVLEGRDAQVRWNLAAMGLATESADPRARRWVGSLANNLGWTYHDAGEFHRALRYFRRAEEYHHEKGSTGALVVARWCVARCLRSLGRTGEGLQIQRKLHDQLAAEGKVDGFVEEELGELLLKREGLAAARPHFAAAFQHLKDDASVGAQRKARLRLLGGG
jgi:tetratricopeptide (TPR) repeat protein